MKRVRVGFVGLGGIARQRHLPGLRRIEGVEVVAVVNRTRESSERAAREFGIPAVCDSWQELVARPDVDAVFIGTWPYLHMPVSVAALDAHKHVFCQARLAMNAEEARAMADRAAAAGRVAMVCPVPIGLAVDATVARLLREGYVGDVRLVRVDSLSDAFADPATPMTWRKDHRLSGLNLGTLGMYIEVVHRWFGWTRTVVAQTQVFATERTGASGARVPVRIPDQALILATQQSGAPVQYTIGTAVHHGDDRIVIHGGEGTLRYAVHEDRLYGGRAGEPLAPVDIPPGEAYDVANWRVERDFIDAIREGTAYGPTFEEGYRYMQVLQAVYDSAELDRGVTLE